MKVVLTGANGQLGRCIQDRMPADIVFFPLTRNELDITDKASVYAIINDIKPDWIINAAAYTVVDKAEIEQESAFKINTQGSHHLALIASELDIPLVHISTDYVFDGTATQPYLPEDTTNPQSIYGESKLQGEKLVIQVTEKHFIIRTAWVFSEYGNNFVKTMLRLAKERESLNIVSDQFGTPTYAGDLADLIVTNIILANSSSYGLHHFNGGDKCSWADFASEIFRQSTKASYLSRNVIVNNISTADFPTAAKRPHYSVLNGSRIKEAFHITSPNWRLSLESVLDRLFKL